MPHLNRQLQIVLVCIVVSSALLGCKPTDKPIPADKTTEKAVSIRVGKTPSEEHKAKIVAAKDALFAKLSARLMEAMANGGPAAAIGVCSTEAKQIAESVAIESNVRIGRTGVRLRNANNTAPTWANKLVQDRVAEPQFVMLDDNRAAALLPIKLQSQCLMCHGPKDQILDEVKEQLQKLFPNDQATGFTEGELRGWFWVELSSL